MSVSVVPHDFQDPLINRHTYACGIWEGIGVCIGVPAKRGQLRTQRILINHAYCAMSAGSRAFDAKLGHRSRPCTSLLPDHQSSVNHQPPPVIALAALAIVPKIKRLLQRFFSFLRRTRVQCSPKSLSAAPPGPPSPH